FQLKNSSLAPAVARLRRRSSMTRSWRAPPHESRSSMTRSWCLAGALLSLVGDVQGVISPSNSSGGVVSPPNSSGGVPAFPIPFPIIPEEADPFARKCGDKVYIKDAQGTRSLTPWLSSRHRQDVDDRCLVISPGKEPADVIDKIDTTVRIVFGMLRTLKTQLDDKKKAFRQLSAPDQAKVVRPADFLTLGGRCAGITAFVSICLVVHATTVLLASAAPNSGLQSAPHVATAPPERPYTNQVADPKLLDGQSDLGLGLQPRAAGLWETWPGPQELRSSSSPGGTALQTTLQTLVIVVAPHHRLV
ncbi:unnamed protein product, partial [Polarella glacialis]